MRSQIITLREGALLAVLMLFAACSEKQSDPPNKEPGYSRVAAVKARRSETKASKWCDVFYHEAGSGPAFRLPKVVAEKGESTELPRDRHSWVNLWATWCKPCLREMPLLGRFREELAADGHQLQLIFLSLDEDNEVLDAFLKAKPTAIPSPSRRLRLANAKGGTSWLTRFGLRAEATIPVHLLVAPDGKLRCLRAGSISDGDYRIVRSMLEK